MGVDPLASLAANSSNIMNEDSKKKSSYPGDGWSNLFSIAGILLIGLTIYDFFMAFACGLGGSGVCDGDSPVYATYCISGIFCIFMGLLLHKKATPVVLDEEE
jgi:hypothetical protein